MRTLDYFDLLLFFIATLIIALVFTYVGGLTGGIIGCVLIALDIVWSGGQILSSHWRARIPDFIKAFTVSFLFLIPVNDFFVWIKTNEINVFYFITELLFAGMLSYAILCWYQITDDFKRLKERLAWRKKKNKRIAAEKKRKLELKQLGDICNLVKKDIHCVDKFFRLSSAIARTSPYIKSYNFWMAYFSSMLIWVGFRANDLGFSKKVFNHYIVKLFPFAGHCKHKSQLAGNALALGLRANDQGVIDDVFHYLIGEDFKLEEISETLLLFNMACYYSLQEDKARMLETMKRALLLGKPPENFLQESDFRRYWNDEDFLSMLDTPAMQAAPS